MNIQKTQDYRLSLYMNTQKTQDYRLSLYMNTEKNIGLQIIFIHEYTEL
jgi:hypothetical protein